jgi:hypothetical protein
MYSAYRLLKPLAFSFSVVTRVLVLGRMLSLISVAKSARVRRIVARFETCGVLFSAASSAVSCVLMWMSTAQTFQAAGAYALAAAAADNSTARDAALKTASTVANSSSRLNENNNSFLLGFYSVYATVCVLVAAVVFHTLRSMLNSIEQQKLLLDELDDSEETKQLAVINAVAQEKTLRLRTVLRKVALNCSVVVVAALFSLWIDSFSVVGGLMGQKPPPPCPKDAGECDECEGEVVVE